MHFKNQEDSHAKKAAIEEMNVGELWDDDAIVAMDDGEDDDNELENFRVTKISMV